MSSWSLLDAARQLWPAPCDVALVRRRGSGAAPSVSGSPTRTLLVLPSVADPRVALPLRPRRAGATAARRSAAAVSSRSAVRAELIAAAVRTGAAPFLRDGRLEVRVPQGAPTLDTQLAEVLGRPVALGLRVGPPRANRKAVLQVVDETGRLLAYAKLGNGPLTDGLVAAETDALERLGSARVAGVRVARVLHAGSWQGHRLLVQEPLPVPARPAGADRSRRLTDAMVAVASTGDAGPAALASLGWWRRTGDAADALPAGVVATALRAARDALAGQQARVLRTGAWHGDWNPGNCALVGDEVLVWDWERYDPEVPAGLDGLHLHLQSALDAGTPPRAAADGTVAAAAQLLAPFGVPAADAGLVAALYLWTLGVRYAGDGQEAAGAAVGRLGEWLLPVLDDAVTRVRSAAGATSSGGVVG